MNDTQDSLERGIDFLKKQDAVFARNAWMHRWLGWVCGWGGTVVAALGSVLLKLLDDSLQLVVHSLRPAQQQVRQGDAKHPFGAHVGHTRLRRTVLRSERSAIDDSTRRVEPRITWKPLKAR